MVERVIRTLKEQCAHRWCFDSMQHATRAIGVWINVNNHKHPLHAHAMKKPVHTCPVSAKTVQFPLGHSWVPYEFGCKRSVATALDEGIVVGMRSFPGDPYDGDTLRPALEQVKILTEHRPELAVVDRGYRGHGDEANRFLINGTRRVLTPKLIAAPDATEADIGHLKTDGRLSRCTLKGTIGDALLAVLHAWLAWIIAALWAVKEMRNSQYQAVTKSEPSVQGKLVRNHERLCHGR